MEKLYKFSLKMHVGAPDVSCVKEGQKVKRGECIAEPNGLGAKIHTSVSGVVEKITDKEIIIKADENQTKEFVKIKKCDNLVDTVFEAGIVGAGGAGFPTHIKLKADNKDGYIIANCVECEPALHHNMKVIEETPELIINGIKYAMKATNSKKGYIAIKAKHEKAVRVLEEALKNVRDIEIKLLKDLYPMGEERAIINAIFDKWLDVTELPISAKCIVMNAETLANITRAVEEGKPVIANDINRLKNIIEALNKSGKKIVLPLHPRTKKYIEDYNFQFSDNIRLIEPVGYLDMITLEMNSQKIVTDSGGVQKEAFFMKKPCITMRDETEWVETVENGWNVVVGTDKNKILNSILNFQPNVCQKSIFGDGKASYKILDIINDIFK
ncbi:proline reductase-associated electron transfer protein PrdC [Clostridium botulinum]|uniref:Proline reductase-associated electron transfer protein PrdC n=2 Tax=Clostridium TaxID=1485 RepID=A0AAU8Z2P2_CLOBO|nr:proline reductase-associated electron transfer protein PrdC [Clostridium botulinum]